MEPNETLSFIQAKLEPHPIGKPSLLLPISQEAITSESLKTYLREKCDLIRIGKIEVIIAHQKHDEEIPLELKAIAEAPNTKAIMVEYFDPELHTNARNFPILGKVIEKLYLNSLDRKIKTRTSGQLAEIAKARNVPIAVADSANRAEYYLGYSGTAAFLIDLCPLIPELAPFAIGYSAMYLTNRIQEFVGNGGLYDTKKIHDYERFIFDTEDARRVFTAMGISKLAKNLEKQSEKRQRILVCYPKAHAIRIANYLHEEAPLFRKTRNLKQKLYHLYPGLDISLRQYEWQENEWKRTSRNKL